MNVILRDGNCPDGAELKRLKQSKNVVVHSGDDASEPINWAIRKETDPGIGLFSIPGAAWERIFGGRNGR